jgi:hypothetical protein
MIWNCTSGASTIGAESPLPLPFVPLELEPFWLPLDEPPLFAVDFCCVLPVDAGAAEHAASATAKAIGATLAANRAIPPP